MKKFLASLLIVGLLYLAPFTTSAIVETDECGEEFTYLIETIAQQFDGRFTMAQRDEGEPGNQVLFAIFTAEEGYVFTELRLRFQDHVEVITFDPAVEVIDFEARGIDWEVDVRRNCPDVCPNLDGDQYVIPDGYDAQCVLIPVCPDTQPPIPDGYEVVDGQCMLIGTPQQQSSSSGGNSSRRKQKDAEEEAAEPVKDISNLPVDEQINILRQKLVILLMELLKNLQKGR